MTRVAAYVIVFLVSDVCSAGMGDAVVAVPEMRDSSPSSAQESERPRFDIASVRECKEGEQHLASTASPGFLSLRCWPLWRLIADAYETFSTGSTNPEKLAIPLPPDVAPAWINNARYTIEAKSDRGETSAMMRGPMMQVLLEDRFKLKLHREKRRSPVYLMSVAQSGLKLKPSEAGGCNQLDPTDLAQSLRPAAGDKPWCNISTITRKGSRLIFDAHRMTLTVFSKLVHPNGLPIIDRTGLTQAYDIHLEWEPEGQAPPAADIGIASDPSPNMSTIIAFREQLGLRLDRAQGSRELLIVDRLEKPSEN